LQCPNLSGFLDGPLMQILINGHHISRWFTVLPAVLSDQPHNILVQGVHVVDLLAAELVNISAVSGSPLDSKPNTITIVGMVFIQTRKHALP
jgi:hypothetical protein